MTYISCTDNPTGVFLLEKTITYPYDEAVLCCDSLGDIGKFFSDYGECRCQEPMKRRFLLLKCLVFCPNLSAQIKSTVQILPP